MPIVAFDSTLCVKPTSNLPVGIEMTEWWVKDCLYVNGLYDRDCGTIAFSAWIHLVSLNNRQATAG